MQGTNSRKCLSNTIYTERKLSTETLMEEVQSIVLETDELESHEKSQAYASFGSFSQARFR